MAELDSELCFLLSEGVEQEMGVALFFCTVGDSAAKRGNRGGARKPGSRPGTRVFLALEFDL